MFILKSLTNDSAQCYCDAKPFAHYKAAWSALMMEFEAICKSYQTKEITVDEAHGSAEVISGENHYSWQINDFPMFAQRYKVDLTSDAYKDPFCIWDTMENHLCCDSLGWPLLFEKREEADKYMEYHVPGRDFN